MSTISFEITFIVDLIRRQSTFQIDADGKMETTTL